MAVESFHDQVSTEECAGRGDRTRGCLPAKRTRFRSNYSHRPQYSVTEAVLVCSSGYHVISNGLVVNDCILVDASDCACICDSPAL